MALKIERPSGRALTDDRARLEVFDERDGRKVAEVELLTVNGSVELIVRRIENDPLVRFTVS